MGYSPNTLISQCIEKNDLRGLRRALCTMIYTDRDFKKGEFLEAVDYVVKKCGIKELYQEFDNTIELISNTKTSYNEEDFSDSIFELQNNFCNERINDVIKIGRYIVNKNNIAITEIKDLKEPEIEEVIVDRKKSVSHQKKMKQTEMKQNSEKAAMKIVVGLTVATIAILGITLWIKSTK